MRARKKADLRIRIRLGYPWTMAPTINTTKLVATAIATFASMDKFIIFPAIIAAIPITPVFGFSRFVRRFEFRRAYGCQAQKKEEATKKLSAGTCCRRSSSRSVLHSSIIFAQHCGIGFLDDSGRSWKAEDEGGKSASGARRSRCDVGAM